jgi:Ni/Fe-hydrogenase 1 B-type cytochrome subunit
MADAPIAEPTDTPSTSGAATVKRAVDEMLLARAASMKSVVVYQVPVRLWHWINALAILVLCITGYFIGQPPPSMPGEASAHFLMGYIRFAHFASGYVFAVGLLGRIYWAFVGNDHARELFTLPLFSRVYWIQMLEVLKWYAFLSKTPGRYVGHNPLARLSMVTGYSLMSVFMLCTGFALYGEGEQAGSWADRWFGWVIPLCGQSQNVHTLHRLGMWSMVVFVIVHIYAVVRDDIVGTQSIVSSMISGRRAFKQD